MDCNTWREMASDYIEGGLEGAAATAMERHVSTCASCRSDNVALRTVCRELNVLPAVDPPLYFRENLISAIERGDSGARRPTVSSDHFWSGGGSLWLRLGRVAFSTLAIGGICAAALWTTLVPHVRQPGVATPQQAGLLPETDGSDVAQAPSEAQPVLHIGHVLTVAANGVGPAYDFSVWLENAHRGTASFQLSGDRRVYRFTLGSGSAPQILRVPVTAADASGTIGLTVNWVADEQPHTKYLFVPVTGSDGRVPDDRQSFGLPEESVVDAAHDIAARYATPVTLDNLPTNTSAEHVMIDARNETASEALRRSLSDRGVVVSVSGAGVLVASDRADQAAAR